MRVGGSGRRAVNTDGSILTRNGANRDEGDRLRKDAAGSQRPRAIYVAACPGSDGQRHGDGEVAHGIAHIFHRQVKGGGDAGGSVNEVRFGGDVIERNCRHDKQFTARFCQDGIVHSRRRHVEGITCAWTGQGKGGGDVNTYRTHAACRQGNRGAGLSRAAADNQPIRQNTRQGHVERM